MGTPRDYYADLELPPTADVQEIKKQFRKLALKYHPDRNPGRETEVNSKFQVIQSAHEVLTDPEQKAKYDATRTRSRYPASSGVKGNPWSNVSAQYPPPPRRNQSTRTPPSAQQPSGAQRWHTRFSSGVPPTAKQTTGADPEAKKNAARAFENMRKGPSGTRETRPPPPPPPPRTESARQRAQAAFGARKSGYQPRSAMPGDEPPVTSSNYTTRPDPERFAYTTQEPTRSAPSMPDPLSQFRDQEIPMDTRQRTPYMSHGGEKTNPFDGIPLGRAKSTRETHRTRPDEVSSSDEGPSFRQRSSSAADVSPTPKTPAKGKQKQPSTAEKPRDDRPKAPLKKTRTNPAFMVDPNFTGTTAPNGPASEVPKPSTENDATKSQSNGKDGPSMYATPPCPKHQKSSYFSVCAKCGTYHTHGLPSMWMATRNYDAACQYNAANGSPHNTTPSGAHNSPSQLTPFEQQQHNFLAQLISNVQAGATPKKQKLPEFSELDHSTGSDCADNSFSNSFNFGVNDDTFAQPSPDIHRFARSSTDDINTSFVDDESSNTWQFSAGGGDDGQPKSRSQSGSRTGHRSPNKRPPLHRVDTPNAASESGKSDGGFNPEGWSDKFGPQTFVPQPPQAASASPTRSNRANSRKPKVAKAAPGSSTVVDDSSSEDELFEWRGRKAQGEPVAAESPQAMDIDSPPAGTPVGAPAGVSTAPSPSPQLNGARNINVEPSRPEWRPGNVEVVDPEPSPTKPVQPTEPTGPTDAPKKDFNPNAVGSEDSEEFRASFADLKNVAPFAQQEEGLKSFTDMKDTLPFDSKPSAKLPIQIPKPPPLQFPRVPTAPTLPATVFIGGLKPNPASWEKYVKDFETYLRNWDAFNGQVADHFSTRKTNIAKSRESQGYDFLESRDDKAIQEYYNWVQQDIDVRRQWAEACEDHQRRLREFMAFRFKMK
ncbi:Fc.00g089600.m01.CDS01 [Cosmosporella sp. VM-42]